MLPKSIELENLRQEIEEVDNESGSLSDYLDRGRPNEQQKEEAQANSAKHQSQSEQLRAQFHALITSVRASEPQAIEEWVQWHQNVCQRIIAEPVHDRRKVTRQFVAKDTLNQWDKVRRGEQEIVAINRVFLSDYFREAQKTFGERGDDWWKFWKWDVLGTLRNKHE